MYLHIIGSVSIIIVCMSIIVTITTLLLQNHCLDFICKLLWYKLLTNMQNQLQNIHYDFIIKALYSA